LKNARHEKFAQARAKGKAAGAFVDFVAYPMKPDGYSDAKLGKHSNLKPDTVPI
jgi:hypothetical protein